MRILIVEDEPDLNGLLKKLLEDEHYAADTCFDGEEALDYVEAAEYDGIILDIMLPSLSGLEVLRRIRAAGKTVPVLLLTAKGSVEDRVRGLDAGADDYLVKPFAAEELLARMRVLMRGKKGGQTTLSLADLSLDPAAHRVSVRAGSFSSLGANLLSWNICCAIRERSSPVPESKNISGAMNMRGARTWWTYISVSSARPSMRTAGRLSIRSAA